jgi:hypothetical protein
MQNSAEACPTPLEIDFCVPPSLGKNEWNWRSNSENNVGLNFEYY